MSQADVIDRAGAVIGEGRDDIVAPKVHAAELADRASAWARLPRTANIESLQRIRSCR